MKRILLTIAISVTLIAALAGVAYAATGTTEPQVLRDLARVRQVTAKYHDVNAALADGFVPTPHCVASPDGGMGTHYINPPRLMDSDVNILEPELLLYAEVGGKLKLLGVEYMVAIGPPDAPVPNPAPPAPVLFGRAFDGPIPPPEAGMPPHYALHAWVWMANPSGIFAPFNPNVHCEH